MGVPLNIDWQQILLHLFNFLILAGGLYLLLYKPVKAFMEKRKAYYADMDAAANAKKAEAEETQRQYAQHLETAEAEAAELKRKALEPAEQAAAEQLAEAKKERQAILARAQREAESEKEKVLSEANAEIESMVSAAIDKMLVSAGADPLNDFLDKAEKED